MCDVRYDGSKRLESFFVKQKHFFRLFAFSPLLSQEPWRVDLKKSLSKEDFEKTLSKKNPS